MDIVSIVYITLMKTREVRQRQRQRQRGLL